jgi:hypothetical protein
MSLPKSNKVASARDTVPASAGENMNVREMCGVCLGFLVLVLLGTNLANAQTPSTSEEKARFVSVAKHLEDNPLDESLANDREWALKWLIQAPDVHVSLCTGVLGNFMKEKYKHSPQIVTQLTFSTGAYVIEHPDADKPAQYLGGVEGTLRAYKSILKQEAKAHSKSLDTLIERQEKGELAAAVQSGAKDKCN